MPHTSLQNPVSGASVSVRRVSRGEVPAWPAIAVAVLGLSGAAVADEVFDAAGFNPNRDYFSALPFEHVDPMTGNLVLTFTDLVLPGNAGFDLRIQRTYNSKITGSSTRSGRGSRSPRGRSTGIRR